MKVGEVQSSLATDDIAALTSAQVQALELGDIRTLTTTQLSALDDNARGLTTEDIVNLGSQISYLSTLAISSLTTEDVVAMSTAQLGDLTQSQVAALTPADITAMSSGQVAALGGDIASMSSTQVAAMEPNDITAMAHTNSPIVSMTFKLGGYGLTGNTYDAVASNINYLHLDSTPQTFVVAIYYGGHTLGAKYTVSAYDGQLTFTFNSSFSWTGDHLSDAKAGNTTDSWPTYYGTYNITDITVNMNNGIFSYHDGSITSSASVNASLLGELGTNAAGLSSSDLAAITSDSIQALSTTALSAIDHLNWGSSSYHSLYGIQDNVISHMTNAQLAVLHYNDLSSSQIHALTDAQKSYLL